MKIPVWLLRLLPMWNYICPKCKKEVEKNSSKCPFCNELYGSPLRVPPKVLRDAKALEAYVHKNIFPRISKMQRDYLTQYFTVLFSDGFEDDFNPWTETYTTSGETLAVSTDVAYCETHSAKATCNGSSNYEYAVARKTIAEISEVYVRLYTYVAAHTMAAFDRLAFIQLQGVSADIFFAGWEHTGGVVQWYVKTKNGSGYSAAHSSAVACNTGTWYCFEVYWKEAASPNGVGTLWVDGVQRAQVTGVDTDNYGGCISVRCGIAEAYKLTATLYIDCVVVADTYIGPEGGVETYTKTWTTDTLFKKLGIPKTLGVDAAIQKQNIQEVFAVDAALQKQNIQEAFAVDAALQKVVTKSAELDMLLKAFGVEAVADVDALFQRLGIQKSADVDALLQKLGVEKSVDVDALLKKLGREKTAEFDALFQKLGILETFGVDTDFLKCDVIKSFALDAYFGELLVQTVSRQIDVLFQKFGITKTADVDAALQKRDISELFALDAEFQKVIAETMELDTLFKKLDTTKSLNVDVALQKTIAETVELDTLLKVLGIMKSLTADALFLKMNEEQMFGVDVVFASGSVVFVITSRGFRQINVCSRDFRQINIASKPFKQINISSRDLEVNA